MLFVHLAFGVPEFCAFWVWLWCGFLADGLDAGWLTGDLGVGLRVFGCCLNVCRCWWCFGFGWHVCVYLGGIGVCGLVGCGFAVVGWFSVVLG